MDQDKRNGELDTKINRLNDDCNDYSKRVDEIVEK